MHDNFIFLKSLNAFKCLAKVNSMEARVFISQKKSNRLKIKTKKTAWVRLFFQN